MSKIGIRLAAFCALLIAAACSSDGVLSTFGGETSGRPVATSAASGNTATTSLALGTSSFVPPGVTLGPETGTDVGRRIRSLRDDLVRLQDSIRGHNGRLQEIRNASVVKAQDYYGIVAAISARLQVGTTPGNPILVSQWGEAQVALENVSSEVTRLNNLAGQVASDSSLAAYLLGSVRATYTLSGAVEEDHRQLGILEDEVNRTVVLIDRLLNEISEDITRQSNYMATERNNLQTLQLGITNGELYGTSLSNRTFMSSVAPPLPNAAAAVTPANIGPESGQPPLVVIRFGQGPVDYRQQVYHAISQALNRRPDARFDVVGVSPRAGDAAQVALAANAARTNAEEVARTLVTMGLPSSRVSATTADSAAVAGPEVQIYVR